MYAFLAVFALTGVAHLELFPFTGFRLFSEVRTDERESWQLRAVDTNGEEAPIRLSELPVGYRSSSKLLAHFPDLSARERDEICDAWAEPLRDGGMPVLEVRVYALVQSVRPDGPPPQRQLAYECGRRP